MIKQIRHKGTEMVINVNLVEEEKINGMSVYNIKGSIISTSCLNIDMYLSIPELAMKDFEVTYKDFDKL